jgi:photosystem II stability/assembly factor-like uncharacterized protein
MQPHTLLRCAVCAIALAWIALGLLPAAHATKLPDALVAPAATSWRAQQAVLLSVKRHGSRLLAVGERGIVLLSTDGGKQWKQVGVPTSVTLTNVFFNDAGRAWIVGHGALILTSADGGLSWSRQLDGVQVAQAELREARVSGDAARLQAAQRQAGEGPDKPLFDIHFFDATNGLAVGAYGLVFATTDAGAHWRSVGSAASNPEGKHLYTIHRNGEEVYIAGEQGLLLKSTDKARTFTRLALPYNGTLFGVASVPGGELVVFGLRGNAYASMDSGQHWKRIQTGTASTLTAALVLQDGSLVLADESGQVLRRGAQDSVFKNLPLKNAAYVAALAETAPGTLLLVGARGITHLGMPNTQTSEAK